MPRFRYRMQNILDIKLKLEEQAKNEYAQAQAVVNEEEQKKEALNLRLDGYEAQSKGLRENSLSIRDLKENQQAIETMKDLIERQQRVIDKAQRELDIKREALTLVMQERKMHEKLKEKALEEYLEEEKAAEAKSIDELTSYTYGQKN